MPRMVKSQENVRFYPQDEESSGSRSNIVLCFFDSKNENPEDFIPRFVNPKDMSVSIPRMSNPQVTEVSYYCISVILRMKILRILSQGLSNPKDICQFFSPG